MNIYERITEGIAEPSTLLFPAIIYFAFSFMLMRIFQKAGVEGWKAYIPVYSQWKFLQIGGMPGWIAVAALGVLIPGPVAIIAAIILWVFTILAAWGIGMSFWKDSWWVLVYVFLPIVWFAVLAFDSSSYSGDKNR